MVNMISPGFILGIGIGLYFLSAVLPGAITNFFTADTASWDTGTKALWVLIPLAVVALLVYYFVPKGGE